MEYDISELIYKSISKTITEEEEKALGEWLSISDNLKLYQKIIDNRAITSKMSIYREIDVAQAYGRVAPRLSKQRSQYFGIMKYAAIFIGLLSATTYFLFQNTDSDSVPSLKIMDEQIVLINNNGIVKKINEDTSANFMDEKGNLLGVQKGSALVYNKNNTSENLVYNTLIVPNGKRFNLTLSDGTAVHLNAGTTIKYPVQFIKGMDRHVFLDGEAYFDIMEDKTHPFIVESNSLEVKVYGTEFNVMAYPENEFVDVVLVEGSVGLYSPQFSEEPTMLKPGYKGTFKKFDKSIDLEEVRTSFYTSWMYGELMFRNLPFDQILKRLERHYNVDFVNENRILGKELFNASFSNQSIENILTYFNETHEIDYKIEDNQIIIN